jgi:ribosome-associated translation inhibitor RaiA
MPLEEAANTVIDTAPPPVGADVSHETPPVTTEKEPVSWDDSVDADLGAIYRKNNPERDANGQYASLIPDEGKDKEITDQAPVEGGEQQRAAIPVPQSWSADVKDVWQTLPPKAQEFLAKRESEMHGKITQQGQELSQFEPIRQVVEQHMDVFERNGVSIDDGIGRLLNAERLLESNPAAAIAQIAQAYGVDLSQFGGKPSNGSDPNAALHQRIAHLESQLNETSTRIQQREQAEAQTQQQSTLTLIEKFASEKSDWADLENDVLTEITGLKAAVAQKLIPAMTAEETLAKAYERAQRNNPAVWAKKLEADKKADDEKRVAEAKKRAEDAKRSNVINVKSSPAEGRVITTIDDTLKQVYRKHNAS